MEEIQTIEETVHALLRHMGHSHIAPTEIKNRDNRVFVTVFVAEPRDLIGERGSTLSAFQHVIRLSLRKRIPDVPPVDIDVNHYKKRREEFLGDFAKQIGERVRFEKKEVVLEPMSAFDRRIIHCALAEYSDIVTESQGEAEGRHIIVRPYP